MATPSMNLSGKTREVVRKVRGQPTSDGAGVRLTRVIGSGALDSFDPFLLLDEFRSDNPNDYLAGFPNHPRSEEHTSELQSLRHLVCRLLLEKKKKQIKRQRSQ